MAIWSNTIKTEKGLMLDQKLLTLSLPLKLKGAKSGGGWVNPTQLFKQTAVTEPKQDLELKPAFLSDETTATIPVSLSNAGLTQSYNLYQVGIYAEDPEEGDILYIIAQTDLENGERVPAQTDTAGYSIDWNFAVKTSAASAIQVVINEAGKLTISQAESLFVKKESGKGLSANNFSDSHKTFLEGLPSRLEELGQKSVKVSATLLASRWNKSAKTYSFETEYPAEAYDISVEPNSTCTVDQLTAWSMANIVGSATTNTMKAFGDVPTVNIPIIIKVVKK
ncbi:MAG: hypothetical protein HFE73_10230 [Firmicutes bacterium]|jgi:hypothetical protein|nr:hypothetical protein [Bacillota bacterium]